MAGSGRHRPLARIIHEFLRAIEEEKEFRTEVTEIRHRDHGRGFETLSVLSVIKWLGNSKDETLRELCVKHS
jgi:uncharacterized protein (UPF0335 family)